MFHRFALCPADLTGREQGQGLVEYASILLLVVLVAAGVLAILGTTVEGLFTTVTGLFP